MVWPRWTTYSVYGILGWSLLVGIVGVVGTHSRWLLDTSPFHHMAAAPVVDSNWMVNAIMIAVGAAGAVLGGLAFQYRDMTGE